MTHLTFVFFTLLFFLLLFLIPIPVGIERRVYNRPKFTYGLMIFYSLLYLIQHGILPFVFSLSSERLIEIFGFHCVQGAPAWQMATHLFLHGGPMHLLVNLLFLYLIGVLLEDRLGGWKMLAIFAGGGVAVAFFYKVTAFHYGLNLKPYVGCSGALAALMGVFCILMPWAKFRAINGFAIAVSGLHTNSSIFRCMALPFLVIYFAVIYFFLQTYTQTFAGIYIPLWTHFGGIAIGMAVGAPLFGLKGITRSESSTLSEEHRLERQLRKSLKEDVKEIKRRNADVAQTGAPEPPSASVLERLVAAEDARKAEAEYGGMIQMDPRATLDPETQYKLARLLEKNGMEEMALVALENLIQSASHTTRCQDACLVAGRLMAPHPEHRDKARDYLQRGLNGLEEGPVKDEALKIWNYLKDLSAGQESPDKPSSNAPPFSSSDSMGSSKPNPFEQENPPSNRPDRPKLHLLPTGTVHSMVSSEMARLPEATGKRPDPELSKELRDLAKGLASEELAHLLDFPPLPGQRPSLPVTSREAICTLLLAPNPTLRVESLLEVLSQLFRCTAEEVATRLRMRAGILQSQLPYPKGDLMRNRLLSAGIEVFLVENRAQWVLPEGLEARGLRAGEGRSLIWKTTGREIETRPEGLGVTSCGKFRLVPGGSRMRQALDLYQLKPAAHLRVWEDVFSFETVQGIEGLGAPAEKQSKAESLRILAQALQKLSPKDLQSHSLRQWLGSTSKIMTPRLFGNTSIYHHYNRWHLLARYAPDTQ